VPFSEPPRLTVRATGWNDHQHVRY
jgi:hypothetical protein